MDGVEGFDKKTIDLAYKYPFSNEAKEIIKNVRQEIDQKMIGYGVVRLQKALNNEKADIDQSLTDNIKIIHISSYVYARMLASALKDTTVIKNFAKYESKRSVNALINDSEESIFLISGEIGTEIKKVGDEFKIYFTKFLLNKPKDQEFLLTKQNIDLGYVYLSKEKISKFLGSRIEKEILKNLPIPKSELPEEIIQNTKKIKIPVSEVKFKSSNLKQYEWIDKLLSHPIADVRHRTVNLILAPYLANILGLDEENAVKIINKYIDKCKEINPDTNVNETYIRYQVRYSKAKGMKPLSRERAKELLDDPVIFER